MSEENMKDLSQPSDLPPKTIYLQWHGEGGIQDLRSPSMGDVTWSKDQIFDDDFKYTLETEQVATLKAALTKAEAERAVMREALRGCHLHIGAFDKYYQGSNLCKANEAALSSTSGSKLLERMEALEKVADAARSAGCTCEMRCGHPLVQSHGDSCKNLMDSLKELDNLKTNENS